MTRNAGWMLAGAILLAMGSTAHAQVVVVGGSPFANRGVVVGNQGFGFRGYNSFYGPTAGFAPVNPGFVAVQPVVRPVVARPYGFRPYRAYGFRGNRRFYGRRGW